MSSSPQSSSLPLLLPWPLPVRLGGVTQRFGRPWRGEVKKGGQPRVPSKHDCAPSASSRGRHEATSWCKALIPGWAPHPNLAWSSLPTECHKDSEFRVASACPPPTRSRDSLLPFPGCTVGASSRSPLPGGDLSAEPAPSAGGAWERFPNRFHRTPRQPAVGSSPPPAPPALSAHLRRPVPDKQRGGREGRPERRSLAPAEGTQPGGGPGGCCQGWEAGP